MDEESKEEFWMYMLLEKEDWDVLSNIASEIASIFIEDMEAGRDDSKAPSFEEKDLYDKLRAQIEYMELKYGPHPIILDTKADFTKDPDDQIHLKMEAINLCFPEDYDMRGNIERELAELYFEEKKDLGNAERFIEASIKDLEKGKEESDLAAAKELRDRISRSK